MQGLAIKSEEDVAWNDHKKNNVAHIFQGQDCTLCTTRVDIRAWKLGNWAVREKKTGGEDGVEDGGEGVEMPLEEGS